MVITRAIVFPWLSALAMRHISQLVRSKGDPGNVDGRAANDPIPHGASRPIYGSIATDEERRSQNGRRQATETIASMRSLRPKVNCQYDRNWEIQTPQRPQPAESGGEGGSRF